MENEEGVSTAPREWGADFPLDFSVNNGILSATTTGENQSLWFNGFEPTKNQFGMLLRYRANSSDGSTDFIQYDGMTYRFYSDENQKWMGSRKYQTFHEFPENNQWVTIFIDFRDRPSFADNPLKEFKVDPSDKIGANLEIDFLASMTYEQFQDYQSQFEGSFIWKSGNNDVSGFVDSDSDGLSNYEEAYYGTDPERYDAPAIAEVGTIEVGFEHIGDWITVKTEGVYEDPVVVIQPVSKKKAYTVATSIRNIQPNSFEVRLSSWGGEAPMEENFSENLHFWVAEEGVSQLPNGRLIEAGVSSNGKNEWSKTSYEADFSEKPLLFTQSSSLSEEDFSIVRVRHEEKHTNRKGFSSILQTSEQHRQAVSEDLQEEVMWIALDAWNAPLATGEVVAYASGRSVNHNWSLIDKKGIDEGLIFANQISHFGRDTSWVQVRESMDSSFELRIQEETSADQEQHHTKEEVNIFYAQKGFMGFYATDADRDADGLPDTWQKSNQLILGESSGFYGDDDNDGLTNYEEYLYGTSAYLSDSDGDGISDYDEVMGLDNPSLATAIGEFQVVQTIEGAAFTHNFGRFVKRDTKAIQATRRGSVTYEFTAINDGIHAVEFTVSNINDGEKSNEYEFIVSLNEKFISREYVAMQAEQTAKFSTLLPSLTAGETYSLTLFVDNSHNFRRVSIDSLALKDATGKDTNGNSIPDWEEIRAQAVNRADQVEVLSLTSPACIQGKAEFFEFMTSSETVYPLPNGRWYSDVYLNVGSTTTVTNQYEGSQREIISITWKAIDPKIFRDNLQLRVGDSIFLSRDATVNGSSQLAGELLFTEEGHYILASEDNTFSVEVVSPPSIEPPVAMVGSLVDWVLPLPENLTFIHDKTVQPYLGENHRVRLNPTSSEDSLIALETQSGAILSTVPVIHNRLRSGGNTGIIQIEQTEETLTWQMPFILDKHIEGLSVVSEIFIGGVTFGDGSLNQEILSEEFNEMRNKSLIYIVPNPPHSNCHRNKVVYQNKVIARYK